MFGDLNKKKRRLWARLKGVQKKLSHRHSNGLIKLERKLRRELDFILQQEELLWFQKSLMQWIVEGERNTCFSTVRLLFVEGKRK